MCSSDGGDTIRVLKKALASQLDLPRRLASLEAALGDAYPLPVGELKLVFV
jgi:hypothetical protein